MKSPNDVPETGEQIPPELKSLKTPLETIIMEGGFDRDVSETGSFYIADIEATYLGKLLSALPMPALLVDQWFTIVFANEASAGLPSEAEGLRGKDVRTLFAGTEQGAKISVILKNVFERKKVAIIQTLLRLPRKKMWCRLHARRLRLGYERLLLILAEDLTLERRQIALRARHQKELKQAHDQLEKRVQERTAELLNLTGCLQKEIAERVQAESELELSAKMIESSSDAILLIDVDGVILRANEAVTTVTGYPKSEIIGQSIEFFQWGSRYSDLSQKIKQAMVERGEWRGEVWDRRMDGKLYPALLSISAIRNDKAETSHYVCIFVDISKVKQTQKRLQRLAHYDSLTGLPNRALFQDRLKQALVLAQRHNHMVALMLLDLDRFKNVNDTMGHGFGDKVLIGVAERLKNNLRASDTAARLGGDEFLVLLPSVPDSQGVITVAQNILNDFSNPLIIDGREVFLTASAGVSTYPNDCDGHEELLRNVDMALHFAKEKGKSHFRFYSQEMNELAVRRQRLERILRISMSQDLLLMYYQPILDISTGSIAGVEALLRWRHPVHGVMSAANLIPVAEETGLIVEIGEWVLRKVCEQVNKWNDLGFKGLRTAVNVSARQLKQRGSVEALVKILEQSLSDPSLMEFELTESVIMEDTEETIAVFHRLKGKGIKLSIDDFGTGYSSLSYLNRLPVDNVKIDGSFIKRLSANTYEDALVRAIVEVAHSRNLRVIAEGVEKREQLKQLSLSRCDAVQGFLISRPLPEDAMTELLKRFAGKKVRIAT